MLLLTVPNLPDGCVVNQAFSMILANKIIEISGKGIIRGMLEKNRNEYTEALEYFIGLAPKEANAIIGVQISSSTQQFSNGVFLYLTIVGTPVAYTDA